MALLIVLEEEEQLDASNMVLVIDDWRLTADYQIDMASMGSLHDWSHGGRLGNWLTINGKSKPDIQIAVDTPVRLRLINAANARIMTFSLAGDNQFEVVAIDGALHCLYDRQNNSCPCTEAGCDGQSAKRTGLAGGEFRPAI